MLKQPRKTNEDGKLGTKGDVFRCELQKLGCLHADYLGGTGDAVCEAIRDSPICNDFFFNLEENPEIRSNPKYNGKHIMGAFPPNVSIFYTDKQ